MTEIHPTNGSEGDIRRWAERPDTVAVMLAHDLRNPLNVAQGRLALAMEDTDSEHLEAVARAHERLEAIIEDYLMLAREGSMAIETDSVDLAAAAEQSWESVATNEATLAIETEQVIRADGNRVRHLLENLMRNAVEHGGGDVAVTIGELDDGFYVADDGAGIPPAEREAVLDAGYSSVEDGAGVGLSIVASIVAAHGWDLDLANADGARFEITGVTVVA